MAIGIKGWDDPDDQYDWPSTGKPITEEQLNRMCKQAYELGKRLAREREERLLRPMKSKT